MRKQKKVLILGGNRQMISIVEAVKRIGIYAIVSDKGAGGAAKEHADESFNFSPSDAASLKKLAAAEGIEGILAAHDDINSWSALKLCKAAGLPLIVTHEQVENANEKFFEICGIFNVPIVQAEKLQESDPLLELARLNPQNLLLLAQPEKEDGQQLLGHTHKVKLYYTLNSNNLLGVQRPSMVINTPAASCRQVSAFGKGGDSYTADQAFHQSGYT